MFIMLLSLKDGETFGWYNILLLSYILIDSYILEFSLEFIRTIVVGINGHFYGVSLSLSVLLKISLKNPTFQAMLGNRYGYQPLQYAFIAKEFDLLYAEAESLCHPKVALLKEWYKRDDNNVPPVYCIQVSNHTS